MLLQLALRHVALSGCFMYCGTSRLASSGLNVIVDRSWWSSSSTPDDKVAPYMTLNFSIMSVEWWYKIFSLITRGWNIILKLIFWSRYRWPRGLRRGPAAVRMLGLRVRIPPGAWMSVSCECCQRSLQRADPLSRGVVWSVCVSECDQGHQ
jgi:hypothetical protein